MSAKSSKTLVALGSIAAGILIANTYYNKKGTERKKDKKWLSWEIELKKSTSEPEKVKILNGIEKHIIDHLYNQNLDNAIIKSIKFSYKVNNHILLSVWVQFDVAFSRGYKGPKPPIPPPFSGESIKFFPSILNIKDLKVNEQLNSGSFNQKLY